MDQIKASVLLLQRTIRSFLDFKKWIVQVDARDYHGEIARVLKATASFPDRPQCSAGGQSSVDFFDDFHRLLASQTTKLFLKLLSGQSFG